jgi:hypothetical protein
VRLQPAGVIAAQPVGHLCEVVGPEREEVGYPGDLSCGESSARQLDHGPDVDLEMVADLFFDHLAHAAKLLDLSD